MNKWIPYTIKSVQDEEDSNISEESFIKTLNPQQTLLVVHLARLKERLRSEGGRSEGSE